LALSRLAAVEATGVRAITLQGESFRLCTFPSARDFVFPWNRLRFTYAPVANPLTARFNYSEVALTRMADYSRFDQLQVSP
jgi:hypothetical protein